jgi:hypothetical protein
MNHYAVEVFTKNKWCEITSKKTKKGAITEIRNREKNAKLAPVQRRIVRVVREVVG